MPALKSSRSACVGRGVLQGSAVAAAPCTKRSQKALSSRTVAGATVGAPRLRSTSLNQPSQRPVARTRRSGAPARSALWKRRSGSASTPGLLADQGSVAGAAMASGARRGRTSGLPCQERGVRPSRCTATAGRVWRRSSSWARR